MAAIWVLAIMFHVKTMQWEGRPAPTAGEQKSQSEQKS
jgi:hypothetical protein